MTCRIVLCAATLLFLSATAFAQASLKVFVTGEGNGDTMEVAQLLRGRIGSTLRYSLTEEAAGADLGVEVICVSVGTPQAGGRTAMVACSSPTIYFSSKHYNLTYSLLGIIMTGDRQYVAEHLFDNLIEDTSPEKLEKMDSVLAAKAREIYMDGYTAAALAEHNLKKSTTPAPKQN
jgi:hypothetical protein